MRKEPAGVVHAVKNIDKQGFTRPCRHWKQAGEIPVSGWTTLFFFNLASFGITMLTLGILGNYLWRTFDASRSRPPYIIEEALDKEENDKGNK